MYLAIRSERLAEPVDEFLSVPVIGTVAAGSPILAEENVTRTFPLPMDFAKNAGVFMLKVKGESMINAGQAGSKYKNYLETAQEIIQGCADIADEVGKQKIGRPAGVTTEGNVYDTDYIESPYSENSKTDFIDNIKSIQNAYLG